ncbi:hypothetical protein [Aquiflexum sp.]|uniref:hypothetical protein n=1 Tax=Aquiflexum sp. TaxID=1872584 RepID=UPI003593A423
MKQIILLSLLFMGTMAVAKAQGGISFWNNHILGKNKNPSPLHFNADIYPFLFFAGAGGSIGLEFNHWQVGLIGFSVVPPEFIKNTFFRNANGVDITQNNAAEIYLRYYLRKDRKGIFFGLLGGPEWFDMRDKATGASEQLVKSYLVPNFGFRVFPFKEYFYVDASMGYSFNLSGTEERTLGNTSYRASSGGMIYFFQLGARFKLGSK